MDGHAYQHVEKQMQRNVKHMKVAENGDWDWYTQKMIYVALSPAETLHRLRWLQGYCWKASTQANMQTL